MRPYTLNDISSPDTQARIEALLILRQQSIERADRLHDQGLYSAEWAQRHNAEQSSFELMVIVGLLNPRYEFEAHSRQVVDCKTSG